MIDGLDDLLEDGSQPGLVELRSLLQHLLGGCEATGKLLETCNLVPRTDRVYRLRFALNDGLRSLVIKRLEPEFARRTELAATRWLPAVGLGENGPPWLGAAAERSGQCVWHVYDDLGDWPLDPNNPELERVRIAVELIARVHTRLADHPLLPECRRYGGDRGGHFFTSNVRDAIRCLESVPPDTLGRSAERRALRDRLLARLNGLLAGQTARAQALAELGGPETLLHGDL